MKLTKISFVILAAILAACTQENMAKPPAITQPVGAKPLSDAGANAPGKDTLVSGEIANPNEGTEKPTIAPIIVKGSGSFTNSQGSNSATRRGSVEQGDITLNFVDADIKDVIKGILGDILGATYQIDPNVQGHITIKTNESLTRSELVPTLEQVLSANGVGLVNDSGKYTVTMLQDIRQTTLLSGGEDGYGSQIVRLRHVAAAEMEKVLAQYSAQGTVKTIETAPNLIVLTGSSPDRSSLIDIISIFDVDRFAGMSFGLLPVSSVDPQTMVHELTPIFGAESGSAQGMIQFVPIDRLNAVLVISPDAAKIDEVRTWIDRLDQNEPTDKQRLYVHYVQHGEAKHIADVLKQIFDADTGAATQNESAKASPAGDDTAQSEYPTGAFPANDASPASAGTNNSAGNSQQSETPPENGDVKTKAGIRIIADDTNNALFIMATPADYKFIDAAIKHLDVTPLQVLIEATIAEVTLNNELKYGVQWFFKQGNSTITLSDAATGAVAAAFPGFGYAFSSSDAKVVLTALDKVTNVKVISSPQIMVMDNRTAKLQVGDEVPVATQTAVSVTTSDAPVVNSIEFKDTGVILTVTPRVNSSGAVALDIEQEVSDVVTTTTSTLDSPTIQQRKIKSSVTVEDGQTIALGGLIRDKQSDGKTGIPLLDDIPVLGNLFKTTDNTGERTELLVLITPRVVRSPSEAKEVTTELRQRVQAVAPLGQKIE